MSKANKDKMKELQQEANEKQSIQDLYARNRNIGDHTTSSIGDELMRKAEKKLGTFSSLFGGSKAQDKALDYLEQAAAQYKMNDNWEQASKALVKAAELYEKRKEYLDAANTYQESGMCLARVDESEAIKLFNYAVDIHNREGRLGAAARVWKDLAQLHEDEGDKQLAIDAWKKAADCHESEDTLANCLQCLLHAADLHVEELQYKKASKLYEKCSEIALNKNINKGSVREYFYKALLCQFIISARKFNLKNLHTMLSRFEELHRQFVGTREHSLIKSTMEAFENNDLQEFTQAVYEQNKIKKLDDLSTQVLLAIKQILKNPPQEDADDVAEDLQ